MTAEMLQVSFRIPLFLVERLKGEARRLSYEQKRNVLWTALVKELLFREYPLRDSDLPCSGLYTNCE